jgi:hypothetical protein
MDFFDELREEAERVTADPKDRKNDYLDKFVMTPEEGTIIVRLLPPSHGMKLPFQATRLHKLNGRSFHCRKTLQAGKWVGQTGVCPVCDHYNWLWNKANKLTGREAEDLISVARRIKPIERFYYNCVVRDDPSQTGTKILSIGKILHKKIICAFVGDPTIPALKKMGNICDTTGKEGRDFMIVKVLQGGFPNYAQSQFLDVSPLGEPDKVKAWLDTCHNLAELRSLKDVAELEHALQQELGVIPADDGGYDPSKFIKGGAVSKPASSAAAVETAVAKTVKVASPVVEEAPFDTNEEVMADTDFLNELNDL